jgi:hypothetical protein
VAADLHPALPAHKTRRSDAGTVRFTGRDIAGLVLAGDMYAAPYDLLALALGMRADRLRAIVARWRSAGLAESGRIGPGPGWCWLTPAGMRAAGFSFPARRPPLARLAHIRAVLAARLSLEATPEYRAGAGWWRSERRVRSARGGPGAGHVPDAEVWWPAVPASPYPEQCWAVEIELTPKAAARTAAIMTSLLASAQPRYDVIAYLCSPGALPAVHHAADALHPKLAARVEVRDLPEGAIL